MAEGAERAGLTQPVFVLVAPQMGENIGATARVMWNFGLDRLRLVAPRDGWPNPRAVAMASGAGRLLDHVGPYADLAAALADLDHVLAATARPRGLTRPALAPDAAMAEARALIARGRRVGVIFGPERAGLTNGDVARCHAILTVPVNPAFPSLNLAQCVALAAYEWSRSGGAAVPEAMQAEAPAATGAEVERLAARYAAALERRGYFWPETRAAGMRRNLRAMFTRLAPTRAEVRMLHGILRALTRGGRGEGRAGGGDA